MVKALVIAAFAWPLLLGATVWARAHGVAPVWTSAMYLATSRLCHQKPERSFHTVGVQWPVCGRCSGLYLAAPAGALLAASTLRRRRRPDRWWLVAASVPTVVTLLVEWRGAHVTNVVRAVAALPLGAAIAYVIARVAPGRSEPIR